MLDPEIQLLLPWHKSLIIRFVFLDLIRGKVDRSIKWLEDNYDSLGDDLKALLRSLKQFLAGEDIDVGESGTLLRFWRYYLLTIGDDRQIIVRRTARKRQFYRGTDVINMTDHQLLMLDNGTSQWASIAALCGRITRPAGELPGHLELTFNAIKLWQDAEFYEEMWPARKDRYITEMVEAWLEWHRTGIMKLRIDNAEKAFFGAMFGLITPEEAYQQFPQMVHHESNRIKAMKRYRHRWWFVVGSRDHRVVQGLAMRGRRCVFLHRRCVNKTWPQFWKLMSLVLT